ncbi:accessory Sec system translocase SecA2 [Lactococcus protaetiae]|uniref:Protein translocase subunit SecA n=1 Tax=Lactococcus protaetiae TaxID=2592653 RepID=A0A514ZB85_9LACT|nr:accessory Sec system translocase SecA2 [Lactococcus protaetiae]QDK71841.1 accessory Sec system translocase SecA2 [Lactococcus protaetiae]
MDMKKSNKYRKYEKITKKIKQNLLKYKEMSNQELKKQTKIFRERIEQGEKLEKILPEAYGVVIEADRRVLGLEPYDVQILGAVILFFGNVAEMKTGEGKTLTATMPIYLRALVGSGNFVVTANEYLAWRDAEDVGRVYRWLGLSVAVGVKKNEYDKELDKQIIYSSDIVYTTHSALGFDYLLDNLAVEKEKQYMQGFNFVIIDELDSILLDMAQTPLIISGAPKLQSNLYVMVDKFVKSLNFSEDYDLSEDKRSVWFLEEGIKKAETHFGVKEILSENYKDLYRHAVLSLKANYVFKNNRDYVLDDQEIFLLDEMNGRKLQGTKLQGGMHQAIEAKEDVEITNETKSMGSITYQNLFKMFKILSGMTGTAKTDAEELRETYGIDVICLPTHKPIIRTDHEDIIYLTHKEKILQSLELVKDSIKSERPVLISTGSVSKSQLYSNLLLNSRIPHSILNASTAYKEKQIISEAGKRGAVTVATAMAGRGTDIKLDKFSERHGGLIVIGTENMTSERIDNQLRGRAGRQGEPGDSYFFASLEDRVVVENAPDWVKKFRKKQENLSSHDATKQGILKKRKYKKLVYKSQKNKKNQDIKMRKDTLDYDDIVSVLRKRVYAARNTVMEAQAEYFEKIIEKSFEEVINTFVSDKKNLETQKVSDFIFNNINYSYDREELKNLISINRKATANILIENISKRTKIVEKNLSNEYQLNYYKQVIILKSLDSLWIDLADGLVQLKSVVKNRNWAQHHPLYEFQIEANRYFTETIERLWLDITRNLLLSELFVNPDGSIDIEFP